MSVRDHLLGAGWQCAKTDGKWSLWRGRGAAGWACFRVTQELAIHVQRFLEEHPQMETRTSRKSHKGGGA
jgi:hypothetical protein